MNKKPAKGNYPLASVYGLFEWPLERLISGWRKPLLEKASGKVLEIGVGTGSNIPHYPEGLQITGIDFNHKMLSRAKKRYSHLSNVELLLMDTETLDFPDNSFDTVVVSFVFCSVEDPVRGFREIKRVCKNNGRILLLEHVRSQKPVLGMMMDFFNPLSAWLFKDHVNRNTLKNLQKADFPPNAIYEENLWLDIVKKIEIRNGK